jgi:hypothetical protein
MQADGKTHQILEEILSVQKEYLAEYRRVTSETVDLQRQAVERQVQFGRLYKRMMMVGLPVVLVIIALIFSLLTLLP